MKQRVNLSSFFNVCLIIGIVLTLCVYYNYLHVHQARFGEKKRCNIEKSGTKRCYNSGSASYFHNISEAVAKTIDYAIDLKKKFRYDEKQDTTSKAIRRAIRITTDYSFHFVGDKDIVVFSAFLDTRRGNFVRFVGAGVPSKFKSDFFCQILNPSTMKLTNITAKIDPINFGFNIKYETTFVLCPLSNIPSPDARVGLVKGANKISAFFKPILKIPHVSTLKQSNGLEMCLGPQYGHFNQTDYLIEFIELNRILGFNHFTFYNYSWSPRFSEIIRSYEKEGLVTVVPWFDLPFPTGNKWPQPTNVPYLIHYFAQIMAFQDCLYRRMNQKNRYIAVQDIDEFMIPYSDTSLTRVVEREMPATSQIACLIVPSTFFSVNYPDNAEQAKLQNSKRGVRLITLRKLTRRTTIFNPTHRSKVILYADRADGVMVHYAFRVHGRSVTLPNSKILLHHYRKWKLENDRGVLSKRVLIYEKELLRRYMEKKAQFHF